MTRDEVIYQVVGAQRRYPFGHPMRPLTEAAIESCEKKVRTLYRAVCDLEHLPYGASCEIQSALLGCMQLLVASKTANRDDFVLLPSPCWVTGTEWPARSGTSSITTNISGTQGGFLNEEEEAEGEYSDAQESEGGDYESDSNPESGFF